MMFRDRIKEFRRVKAKDLVPHDKNWRKHPQKQQQYLKGILKEVGYADALLARELPSGALQLLDGHLRAETTPNQEVPVLILDIDEKEAEKILAFLDPLTAFAETDHAMLSELLANMETENQEVKDLITNMISQSAEETMFDSSSKSIPIPTCFQIIVQVGSEKEQRIVYEQLSKQGHACRIVNL